MGQFCKRHQNNCSLDESSCGTGTNESLLDSAIGYHDSNLELSKTARALRHSDTETLDSTTLGCQCPTIGTLVSGLDSEAESRKDARIPAFLAREDPLYHVPIVHGPKRKAVWIWYCCTCGHSGIRISIQSCPTCDNPRCATCRTEKIYVR